jgi:hypothetical protein
LLIEYFIIPRILLNCNPLLGRVSFSASDNITTKNRRKKRRIRIRVNRRSIDVLVREHDSWSRKQNKQAEARANKEVTVSYVEKYKKYSSIK